MGLGDLPTWKPMKINPPRRVESTVRPMDPMGTPPFLLQKMGWTAEIPYILPCLWGLGTSSCPQAEQEEGRQHNQQTQGLRDSKWSTQQSWWLDGWMIHLCQNLCVLANACRFGSNKNNKNKKTMLFFLERHPETWHQKSPQGVKEHDIPTEWAPTVYSAFSMWNMAQAHTFSFFSRFMLYTCYLPHPPGSLFSLKHMWFVAGKNKKSLQELGQKNHVQNQGTKTQEPKKLKVTQMRPQPGQWQSTNSSLVVWIPRIHENEKELGFLGVSRFESQTTGFVNHPIKH